MVLTKKSKKYLRKAFSARGLPNEIITQIFSYDTKFKDLLPEWVYTRHMFVEEYDEEYKCWVGVDELEPCDYDSEDNTYMQFLTFYYIEMGTIPHYDEDVIDVEEGNIWIRAVKDRTPRYSSISWIEE